jgi:HAE1 family hydrophobic/amphiphilic exporter-1
VPVSLFPGTTGRLYQQFALTIAFSIALSAFNALTLTPALSALLLRHTDRQANPFVRTFNRGLAGITEGYRRLLTRMESAKTLVVILFLAGLASTAWLYKSVPTSFVPDEDQGYFIVLVQAPDAASLEYTSNITTRASAAIMRNPDVLGVFAIPGFSFAGASPNHGLMFVNLRPLAQRRGPQHSLEAVIDSVRGPLGSINEAMVIPFAPPAIEGLSTFGGFTFELQQTGFSTPEDLDATLQKLLGAARQRPELSSQSLYSSYTARAPQILVQIDREKAESLGVPFSQINSTLQTFMGSTYVNDFDFNNRSYRVYVQADQNFRANPADITQYYVRSDAGVMVPLSNIVTLADSAAPSIISHYNLFRSAEINGSAAPGHSSGQALAAMEDVSQKVLPPGYSFEWTGLALEEISSGNQAFLLFGLGLLVVYLVLSAQYESFVLPFIILLSVPTAILGALGAQSLRGLQNDVYCQIGLVMLIGLASKNGILIVEFAEQLQRNGVELFAATVEAARLRLRPILMTSVAFILGVLPLVFASGAGSAGRHSVGTTVCGGMIVSTVLNLFLIPILYVIVRSLIPVPKSAIPEPESAQ